MLKVCSTWTAQTVACTTDPVGWETYRLIAKQSSICVLEEKWLTKNSCSINYKGKSKNGGNWEQSTFSTRHCNSTIILTHGHFCVMLRSYCVLGLQGEFEADFFFLLPTECWGFWPTCPCRRFDVRPLRTHTSRRASKEACRRSLPLSEGSWEPQLYLTSTSCFRKRSHKRMSSEKIHTHFD